MTAPTFFEYAFATSPDTTNTTTPQASATPSVSYQNGYPINYQLDLISDPNALPISRTQMNGLFNDITSNIQQYQLQGVPNWYSFASTNGLYPLYARVIYTDGKIWENQIANNTAVPGLANGWLIISGGNNLTLNTVTISSTGTYTPSANMVFCTVVASGAGGGGGGAAANSITNQNSAGGGGSSGETRMKTFSSVTIGASKSVTIGAAGSAGTTGAGGTGGSTLFGTAGALLTAGGGYGGTFGVTRSGVNFELGGSGSVTGSGGVAVLGAPGGVAFVPGTAGGNSVSGAGASGYYGGGAVGVTGTIAGNAASTNNSGGSGGASITNSAANGGAGGAGIVVITEYIYA